MTAEEIINEIEDILEELSEDEDAVSYLTQNDMKWLGETVKALEQESVLDKVKAEIKEWYWQADKQVLAKDPCVVDAMIDLFIRTIDKYKAGK